MKWSLLPLAVSIIATAHGAALANFPNSVIYAIQTDGAGNIYVAGF